MKLFTSFLLMTMTLFSTIEVSAVVVPVRRDYKMASQQMIEKQAIDNAILADNDRLKVDQATSASVITTVTSFLAQPDVCRNITITPGDTTADVPAGDITVAGTNFFGASITEAITLAANATGLQSGAKAFCTVSSVVFPIQDGSGATYKVGVGDVLGLKRCMSNAGQVLHAVFDSAYETTRPTCVADADEVEKNTCDINGTLNGAKDIEIYFMQNFACLP